MYQSILLGHQKINKRWPMTRHINPEMLPFVTEIRHRFTNYDRLVTFYQYYRHKRSILNGVIYALIKEEIDIPTFKERVAKIEAYVDLTKKENQKRFLKTEQERLNKQSIQQLSPKTLKQFAKNNLSSMLHGKCVAKNVDRLIPTYETTSE